MSPRKKSRNSTGYKPARRRRQCEYANQLREWRKRMGAGAKIMATVAPIRIMG